MVKDQRLTAIVSLLLLLLFVFLPSVVKIVTRQYFAAMKTYYKTRRWQLTFDP